MASLSDVTAAGGAVLGSIVGEFWASGEEKKRKRLMEQAMQEVTRLNLPPLEAQRVQIQLAELFEQGPSAMEGVRADPFFANVQKQAVQSFQEQAQGAGLDAAGKAAMFAGRTAAGQAAAGRQGAIRQDMRARGMRGSGLDFLAQQLNAQNEAGQVAAAGFQAASDSQARREQARAQGAALAGQASAQDFSQQAARAQAMDEVAARNMAARNQNSQYNAAATNQGRMFNARQMSDRFNQELALAEAKANARRGMAGYYGENANRRRGIAADSGRAIGAGIGKGIEMYYTGGLSEMGGMFGGGGGGTMV